jgi:DNA-binding transcriptional LysR family regulator
MNLLSFDFNLLRVLAALLETHSTVKAGEKIGLSQPAISAALGRLRVSLNDPLFVREGQKLVPTQKALDLQVPLHNIMRSIESVIDQTSEFDPQACTANFVISGSDFFAELLLPRLGQIISNIAPNIRLQMVDQVIDNQLDTMRREQIDLALIPQTNLPDWAESRLAITGPFEVVANRKNLAIREAKIKPGEVIPLDLYCAMGHVLFSNEGKMEGVGDQALRAVGRQRKISMTVPFFNGVANAVSNSELIALLPSAFAHHVRDRLALEIYHPPMPVPQAHIHMVWHRRNSAHKPHAWFRQIVLETLSEI